MRWFRKPAGDPLAVSMSGLKLGDRLLMLGCSDTALAAALASKVGLTGRACLLDESTDRLNVAAAEVEREGALVESVTSPMTALPFEPGAFDVVVARNVFPAMPAASRAAVVGEVTRVVRAGGRCIVIDDLPRGALGGLIGGHRSEDASPGAMAVALLTGAGFRGVRTLAEREGFVFVEGVKAGDAPS
jgi:ubiquinone/menaquinone biosynthesis C-methylase UbiE